MKQSFRLFAQRVSEGTGSPWAFMAALSGVVICSIIPSLMVFLIQNTQNRDSKAMQLKLDELIRASGNARNQLIHLEAMTDADLDSLEQEFQRARATRQRLGVIDPQAADTTRSTSSP
jgi:low affinity Fe/Cu permease